jgi:hypothetical protein
VPSTLAGVTCTPGAINGLGASTITITASSTARNVPAPPRNYPFGPLCFAVLAAACLALWGLWKVARPPGRLACVRAWLGWPCHIGVELRSALAASLRYALLAGALACLLTAIVSCGGGSSSGGGGGGTAPPPPESGTVTITGTGPNSTHTATISVTVN